MKKTLIALAAVASIAVAIPAAMAQFGPNQAGPGQPGPGMRGGPNVEMMAKILDLTPEQQEKMKTLFAEQAKQREAMRTAMQAEMQNKLQSILTEEQYAKMQELRQYRQESRGHGMRGDFGNCRGQSGMSGPNR